MASKQVNLVGNNSGASEHPRESTTKSGLGEVKTLSVPPSTRKD